MMFGRGGVAAVEAVVAAAAAALTRTYTARAEDAVRWTMLAGGGLLARKGEGRSWGGFPKTNSIIPSLFQVATAQVLTFQCVAF